VELKKLIGIDPSPDDDCFFSETVMSEGAFFKEVLSQIQSTLGRCIYLDLRWRWAEINHLK